MGFRYLSCDLAGGLLYTRWPLDVRSLGHRDVIARDSITWHTLLYDWARPRSRLGDRDGVCLCKCYNSIENMFEATCLWVWEFTTHIHLDLWADDEDPSQLIIWPGWDAPHVRCFPRTFYAWPCLLRQVGTILGSPYDYFVAGLAYANPESRQTWYQSRTDYRIISFGRSRV